MNSLEILGTAASVSLLAGWRLYATVAAAGIVALALTAIVVALLALGWRAAQRLRLV